MPARDRFDVWRDLIGRKLFRMSIDPIGEAPYRAKAALRALPSLKIGIGSVSAAAHHHTREIGPMAENDDVLLMVNLRGSLLVRRAGMDLVLGPGRRPDRRVPRARDLCDERARPALGSAAVAECAGRVVCLAGTLSRMAGAESSTPRPRR